MQATKEMITEESFLGALYKNAKMGADAIINLLPKVKNDALRSDMTTQLDGYEKYAARAEETLAQMGVTAKEENFITRMSARAGMAMQTMLDTTSSHIAEMMIDGSNMGITDTVKLLNHYTTTDSEAVRLAKEMVRFEEHNLEMMKRYL